MASGLLIVVYCKAKANRCRKMLLVINWAHSLKRATHSPSSSNNPKAIHAALNVGYTIPSTVLRFSRLVPPRTTVNSRWR